MAPSEGPHPIPEADCPQHWRLNREARFTWRQKRVREWINFQEIADWLADLYGSGVPNEAARANAYDMLVRDLLAGYFEEAGREKVLYLYYGSGMARMTRQRLNDILDTFSPADVRSQYLAHCWIPRRIFDRWLAKHELPRAPERFEPATADIKALLPPDVEPKAQLEPAEEPLPEAPVVRNAAEWITTESRRMKAAGEIPAGINKTAFAKMVADRMQKAARAQQLPPHLRPVGQRTILNRLERDWGLWPIDRI